MTHEVNGFPGREIFVDNKRLLYFGGTAYLGLQTDATFQSILIENIKKFGTNYGASRKANVRLSIYKEAERHLANILQSESCLTVSSGFLSGQLIARYFHKKGNACFYAPNTHEALHLLSTENYSNTKTLATAMHHAIEEGKAPVLFIDSIFLDGKVYPQFSWLKELPLDKIILVVDDSHGLGIIGNNGGGVYSYLKKIRPKALVVCGSLGKGFGIQAGLVAGSDKIIEQLRSTDIFASASPAAPANLSTLLEAQEVISEKRHLLLENIVYFLSELSDHSTFDFIRNYPCFSFDNNALAHYLLENDIVITNFHYPTVNDTLVQRIVLSAHHQKDDIKKLANTINKYFAK